MSFRSVVTSVCIIAAQAWCGVLASAWLAARLPGFTSPQVPSQGWTQGKHVPAWEVEVKLTLMSWTWLGTRRHCHLPTAAAHVQLWAAPRHRGLSSHQVSFQNISRRGHGCVQLQARRHQLRSDGGSETQNKQGPACSHEFQLIPAGSSLSLFSPTSPH